MLCDTELKGYQDAYKEEMNKHAEAAWALAASRAW